MMIQFGKSKFHALSLALLLLLLSIRLLDAQGMESATHAKTEQTNESMTRAEFRSGVESESESSSTLEVNATLAPVAPDGWRLSCTANVLAGDYGLRNDIPGIAKSNGNEAGLLWFVTDEAADEKCSALYNISPGVATNSFPALRVLVAINDGALFKIEVFDNTIANCANVISSITSGASDDNSTARLYTLNLPANRTVCKVQLTLDDDANNVASERAAALIDYVQIWNPANNNVGWSESFSHFSLPAECKSTTMDLINIPDQLTQRADKPYWQFILNFDVWSNNQPTACVRLYHQGEKKPFNAISIPCTLTAGAFQEGKAVKFEGGYVQCPVRLRERVAALNDPFMVLNERYDYPKFTIAGAGRLNPIGATNVFTSNPIILYQPGDIAKPKVGLFAPLRSTTSPTFKASMVSTYGGVQRPTNNLNNLNTCLFSIANPPPLQGWFMLLTNQTLTHKLQPLGQPSQILICNGIEFQNPPNVEFWTSSGTVYVGGQSIGSPLFGYLDEVVIDPTGSIQPPK